MNGNEFLAITQQNGENAVLNVANVKLFKPREYGIEGATAVLMDGSVLHLRDDYNALALRLAFLPVPPRPREQMEFEFVPDNSKNCPACGQGRGSADLCLSCSDEMQRDRAFDEMVRDRERVS